MNAAVQPDISGTAAKNRAPTLYAIISVKLGKALLLLLLALGIYSLSEHNLPNEFRALLKALHLDPERKFFTHLAEQLGHVTPGNIYMVAAGTVGYGLLCAAEGIGLIFRAGWAGWMAIAESVFFIPIEIYELSHGFRVSVLVILGVNILIVWYLLKNRRRLFKHHDAGCHNAVTPP